MGSGGAPTGTGRSVDVCVVGGAGHVGLPLSILLAAAGQRVLIYDVAEKVLERLRRGEMPFVEYDADPLLRKFAGKTLTFTSDRAEVARARMVIMAIGTPVDEFLNPNLRALLDLFASLQPFLRPEQTIIIRSTVYPGTCRRVQAALARDGREWHLAYCPERIAQGYAVRELKELPPLVSGLTGRAAMAALQDAIENSNGSMQSMLGILGISAAMFAASSRSSSRSCTIVTPSVFARSCSTSFAICACACMR
ncbi:MAG: hypothetical protein AAB368_09355, partial [bacterium]